MADDFSVFEVPCDPSKQLGRPTKRGRYLKGTSMVWLRRAALLSGRALHVAIIVKHQSDMAGGGPVRLSKSLVASFGLDRWAERRALRELEAAGVLKVERHTGRRPRVTLLAHTGEEGDEHRGHRPPARSAGDQQEVPGNLLRETSMVDCEHIEEKEPHVAAPSVAPIAGHRQRVSSEAVTPKPDASREPS